MATVIIEDGPGYGVGIRYVGDVDPGAIGAFAVWLYVPAAPAVPLLRVRNAANTAWLAAGGGGLAPMAAWIGVWNMGANAVPLPVGPANVLWDPLVWYTRDNVNIVGAAITAQLAGMGLSYNPATGVFTVLAGGDGVYAIRVDAEAAVGPTTNFATVFVAGSAGYGYLSGAAAYIPAGSIKSFTVGIGVTDTLVAGDTFHVQAKQTAGETDLSFVSLGIVRVR